MDKIKPWQIILILVALAGLGFSVWNFGFANSLESQLADTMTLVDVQSGQLYTASIGGRNGILIPARNPETREIALMPVYRENDQWFLIDRYKGGVSDLTVATDAIPDVDGPITVNDSNPLPYRR